MADFSWFAVRGLQLTVNIVGLYRLFAVDCFYRTATVYLQQGLPAVFVAASLLFGVWVCRVEFERG